MKDISANLLLLDIARKRNSGDLLCLPGIACETGK